MVHSNGSTFFEKEEDRQLAGVLSALLWASWGLFLFAAFTSLYFKDWKTFIASIVGCILLFVPFFLYKGRHLEASSLFVVLMELATVTAIATVGQGIRDISMVAFPIILVFAGLVLKRKYFRVCVGLTMLAVVWLVLGEIFGIFTPKPFVGGFTNWFYLIGMLGLLIVAAIAVDLLAANVRSNLNRALNELALRKQAEQEVLHLNASLEQRVEERSRQLQETQDKLSRQEKLAMLGQMAGGVSHELRNPLGIIGSSVYYLKLVQPDASEKIKQHLGLIEQEVRNAEKIISDLLDNARIKPVKQEPISVRQLITQTLDRYSIPAAIDFHLDLPEHLPELFVDPRQLEQVLGNLVTNACQAMAPLQGKDPGNAPQKLTISAWKVKPDSSQDTASDFVAIAIQDTGKGIPPENMKNLFEPLFTTRTGGIGLGLAVSRKMVEDNAGRILVESELGQGTKFTLFLPVSGAG